MLLNLNIIKVKAHRCTIKLKCPDLTEGLRLYMSAKISWRWCRIFLIAVTLLRLSTSLLANVVAEDQKDICGCASSPGLEKKQNKTDHQGWSGRRLNVVRDELYLTVTTFLLFLFVFVFIWSTRNLTLDATKHFYTKACPIQSYKLW